VYDVDYTPYLNITQIDNGYSLDGLKKANDNRTIIY
jgi:hypothetical protein